MYTFTDVEPLGTAHNQFPPPFVKMLVTPRPEIPDTEDTLTDVGPAVAPGPLMVN
ncbi:MAG TPA: hypothetical protein VL285_02025 [Bryobacteraceae bacterium]|jgi:hypothetical protein|nr:hypothetical protein [Bryobacteraceae bacterium]